MLRAPCIFTCVSEGWTCVFLRYLGCGGGGEALGCVLRKGEDREEVVKINREGEDE